MIPEDHPYSDCKQDRMIAHPGEKEPTTEDYANLANLPLLFTKREEDIPKDHPYLEGKSNGSPNFPVATLPAQPVDFKKDTPQDHPYRVGPDNVSFYVQQDTRMMDTGSQETLHEQTYGDASKSEPGSIVVNGGQLMHEEIRAHAEKVLTLAERFESQRLTGQT